MTFDDGFADFHTDALPVLERHGFAATLYIATGLVGATNHWLYEQSQRPILNWDQIVEISASGIECGAHTHGHPQLDTLPIVSARKEIFQSKEILEQRLSQPVATFAYPHGYYSSRVRRLVQEAGFSSACAVKHAMSAPNDDIFALARVIIRSGDNADDYGTLLAGDGLRVAPRRERVRTKLWRLFRKLSASAKRRTENAGIAESGSVR